MVQAQEAMQDMKGAMVAPAVAGMGDLTGQDMEVEVEVMAGAMEGGMAEDMAMGVAMEEIWVWEEDTVGVRGMGQAVDTVLG